VSARAEAKSSTTWPAHAPAEIATLPDEIVVPKARYCGSCGTDLDGILRAHNIRRLIATGLTSAVCVESTSCEAYHREYFCLLVDDATQQSGQRFIHDAVLYNVQLFSDG
jgi:ureidoacrylate peracid hydrolase